MATNRIVFRGKGDHHFIHRTNDAFQPPLDAFHLAPGLAPLGDVGQGAEDGRSAAAFDHAHLHLDDRITTGPGYGEFNPIGEVSSKKPLGAVFAHLVPVCGGDEGREVSFDDLVGSLLQNLKEGLVRKNNLAFPDDHHAFVDVLDNALIINVTLAYSDLFSIFISLLVCHGSPLVSLGVVGKVPRSFFVRLFLGPREKRGAAGDCPDLDDQ